MGTRRPRGAALQLWGGGQVLGAHLSCLRGSVVSVLAMGALLTAPVSSVCARRTFMRAKARLWMVLHLSVSFLNTALSHDSNRVGDGLDGRHVG